MSGTFNQGETKVRPGNYFRYVNGGGSGATNRNGIVATIFAADWGPLNQIVDITDDNTAAANYGNTGNSSIIKNAITGGASVVKAVRAGTGGTKATINLQDGAGADVVKLTARYVGARPLSVTIRDNLGDAAKRDAIIYSGVNQLLTVSFAKGTGEPAALVAAINAVASAPVVAEKIADGDGKLSTVTQVPLTGGTSPTVGNTDYSNAMVALEADTWGVLCVDSIDPSVHALVNAYIARVQSGGLLALAVVGERSTVELSTRMANAAAFNTPNMIYVLNSWNDPDGVKFDGWEAASVIAGMVAAIPSNDSLTHKSVTNAVSVAEALTNPQVEQALSSGCLVITMSRSGRVWIESGINTLVTPASNQDDGWKKIRRTKCRYELMTRVDEAVEDLIGSVTNDQNGRATYMAKANGVAKDMIAEGKLQSCNIYEDPDNTPKGDSAWFTFDVVDLDSIEHTYDTFIFRFAGA